MNSAQGRLSMAASPSSVSGLEVLLSTLQNSGDTASTLNILNVLDELLSAGTDRRIHYMISKGGSEALLTTLVNTCCNASPNYTMLLPLLHLLAKIGHRDRHIGLKAEKAGAVLLTLNLLKHNIKQARRASACLWVIQVLSSSVSTAKLIGENHGLDIIYSLLPQYTTKHLLTVKAAIHAFAALLCTKTNVCLAVSKGYISGLLRLYEDWHGKGSQHGAPAICHALLRCLHKVTHRTTGRQAIISQGGIKLLHQITQTCLSNKGLETLVEPTVQLMRKCLPKTCIPLASDRSAYTFALPGRPHFVPDTELASGIAYTDGSSEDSDDEEADDSQEADKDYDDDLETDVSKLRLRPDPDRPKNLLPQYSCFCPEFSYNFQEMDLVSEQEESSTTSSSSSDEDIVLLNSLFSHSTRKNRKRNSSTCELSPSLSRSNSETGVSSTAAALMEAHDFHRNNDTHSANLGVRTIERQAKEQDCRYQRQDGQDHKEKHAQQSQSHRTMIDILLERRRACIPNHEPKLYCSAAAKARSIPGFTILAFPDFWGHISPSGREPMAPRKPDIQRKKVLEDIQRFLNTGDIINRVVFDLEDDTLQGPSDSLWFFSKFESGNLRKAVQVRRYEYDLILNADANCSQHSQWFYFEVSNMMAEVPYRFNIINCEKSNSQFNYGMQPVLYSVREALEGRPHWIRSGTEVCYFRNHFYPTRGRMKTSFYTLTFTITFKHSEDVCYLAYHYPYTYSALKTHLNVLQKSVDPAKVFFRQQILCHTLSGNSCPLVTITACPASSGMKDMQQLRDRPCIMLTARVHPGESNASWVMKGTLEFLCSSDLVAQSLREAFVFKIIPMLNPDGVINGMNRCDLNSEDLNRQWCKPDPILNPTIYHTKGLLYYLNSIGRTPLVFCDYHGHSRKKNVFLYGCSVKETLWQSGSPVDTVGLKEDPGYRTIPKALDRIAPAFSFNSCNYLVEKSRSATARVVVWREMGVLRSYTMESTYNGCNQGIYKGLQIGTLDLQEMGVKFCQSLLSLTRDTTFFYSRSLVNHINLDHNILDHNSHNCFEDDEPPFIEDIEYSTDCTALKGTDLDSDVNSNIPSADEESEGDEEHMATQDWQDCIGQSQ
ncbi:cytosolic carboxypeptidase 4 [Antennarius striatus]|uniref:cytosolic carboxypeptidase 4 n=1 Tax=Antennarius striatus TaxID=241820 RepID=UPI0035B4A46F